MTEHLIDQLFLERRYADSVDCCLMWLEVKRGDPVEYANLDKGTRFYFLGVAAFASHDYQSATFFFDAAALEDLRHPNPDRLPAHLFMCLDAANPNQAGLDIVQGIVHKLNRAIDNYKERAGAVLLLSDIMCVSISCGHR
jgi:hypothetical protein